MPGFVIIIQGVHVSQDEIADFLPETCPDFFVEVFNERFSEQNLRLFKDWTNSGFVLGFEVFFSKIEKYENSTTKLNLDLHSYQEFQKACEFLGFTPENTFLNEYLFLG